MPPANSRATSPPELGPSTPYLSAFRDSRPTTQAGEEPSVTSQSQLRAEQDQRDRLRVDQDQRDRLRRVMNRLRSSAYSDRIPNQNSLYDWSPANEADDEDELDQILAELRRDQPDTHPEILRVLGQSQLDTEREARLRLQSAHSSRLLDSTQPSAADSSLLRSAAILQSVRRHPRFSARTRDNLQRHGSDRASVSRASQHDESRERYSGSASRQISIQRMSERRASLERERDRDRERDREREREWERDYDRDALSSRVESFRRNFLDRSSGSLATASPRVEKTIQYLSRIRHLNTTEESRQCAIEAGLLKDPSADERSDFVLDHSTLPPPAPTSWLVPGAVLSGCQHATTAATSVTSTASGATNTLFRFRNGDSMTSTLFESSRPWSSQNYTVPRRWNVPSTAEPVSSHSPQKDRWPVKVTIHSVDYDSMSLSATMDAYNVPSHPHAHYPLHGGLRESASAAITRTSSITTYLEGEILDFRHHTLLTESFKSSAANDATYWRGLPCFQKYTDDELVRNLTSRQFFHDVLSKEWVLMRWKERCFVKSLSRSTANDHSGRTPHDSFQSTTSSRENHYGRDGDWPQDEHLTTFDDSSCGLTISGFYYVCLRRSDGKLDGLYHDPQSTPFQCLKLESVNGGVFPAWGFR